MTRKVGTDSRTNIRITTRKTKAAMIVGHGEPETGVAMASVTVKKRKRRKRDERTRDEKQEKTGG